MKKKRSMKPTSTLATACPRWGHHGGLQGVQSVMVGTIDDPLPGFKKIIFQGGADLQQERSILPGHVCEPGHHGVLQGVQSVTMDPVDDSLPSATLLK